MNRITITPTFSVPGDIPIYLQVGNYLLNCSLSYANFLGNLTSSTLGVLSDINKHPRVVGQECPSPLLQPTLPHAFY